MPEPKWYTKQGPDGKWYKTQASSPEEATQKLLAAIGRPNAAAPPAQDPHSADALWPRGATIGPAYNPSGLAGIEHRLNDLKLAFENFGDRGFARGATESLPLTSPVEGILRLLRANVEAAEGKPWQSTKDTVGGLLKAGELPSMFVGPEVKAALPTAANAGRIFEEVEKVAGKVPIKLTPELNRSVGEAYSLAQSGGSMPKVIRDFLTRVTKPNSPPLTYSEARQFYSNATRLSAEEATRLTPVMRRAVADFTQRLGDSLWEAAQSVGKGGRYNDAMRMYSRASSMRRVADKVAPYAAKAGMGAAAGAGGLAAYELYKMLGGTLPGGIRP